MVNQHFLISVLPSPNQQITQPFTPALTGP